MSEKWMFMSGGFRRDPFFMVRGNGNAVAVIHKGDGFPLVRITPLAYASPVQVATMVLSPTARP